MTQIERRKRIREVTPLKAPNFTPIKTPERTAEPAREPVTVPARRQAK